MSSSPYKSGVRSWQINKNAPFDCAIIDAKAKTLLYNKNHFWIRFETQSKLYIYRLPDRTPSTSWMVRVLNDMQKETPGLPSTREQS